MLGANDPVRLKAAEARFHAFFRELEGAFAEREDVLRQLALALLCREHVLLTGPPGTAKSQLAAAVLGRILDEETGAPSLYARQFTESTVQTDLIGPINFKTLTETGRTEHFTDEGMLGAVHAFLDEVFDGRDMLLRATLNVLHERELKQGTRITRGRFECAVMASNRYLAEILEGSRDTLLAFVDRIAFVGFVPRGFSDPDNLSSVLKRQVGAGSRTPLEAPLTVQDVDAVQAMVDAVDVSDAICDGLAKLVDLLDAELNAAVRADPTFIPTRYLSTRTAVRSGRILKGICAYDKIFDDPARPLQVLPKDLAGLRFHLLLSGPKPDTITRLLERETDARERRQLGIVRTEREIFERCWAKLPAIQVPPLRPTRPPPSKRAASAPVSQADPAPASAPRAPPAEPARAPSPLEKKATNALDSGDPKRVAEVVRELASAASAGGAGADDLLKQSVAVLHAAAARAALAPGAGEKPMLAAVEEIAQLAETLDRAGTTTRPDARWLRGRAIEWLGDAAGYGLGVPIAELAAEDGAHPWRRAERRIEGIEAIAASRRRLAAAGADVGAREAADASWARGVRAAEDDTAILADAAVLAAAGKSLGRAGSGDLAAVLAELAGDFDRVAKLGARIGALRSVPAAEGARSFEARVLGPRVGALVAAGFDRLDVRDRASFSAQIDAMLGILRRADLASVIAPKDWLRWTATALVRSEPEPVLVPEPEEGYDGYLRLRAWGARVSSAYVLADVAARVAPSASPPGAVSAIVSEIPDPTRSEAARLDLDRIRRALDHLEAWWRLIEASELQALAKSRFFDLLLEDSALARFVAEARLVGDVFPDHATEASALRDRLDALEERARRRLVELFGKRADTGWAYALRGRT